MGRRRASLLTVTAFGLALAALALQPGTGVETKVTRVYDGDTIEVLDGERREKVRYIGIDTPELSDTREPVLELARAAAAANRRLVGGRMVRLESDVQARDSYGRRLAYVWLGDTLVNEWLVSEGYAAARSFPPNVRYQERLAAAERSARDAGRRLWDGRLAGGPLRIYADRPPGESEPPRPGDGLTIDAFEADRHVGRTATVCGPVASARYLGGGGLTFLNLERPYPDQPFTIVIPSEVRRAFGTAPEREFLGRDVCVAGAIELHRGKPQVMLRDPVQLEGR